MLSKKLIIGTRGSALALYQANLVQRLLKEAHPSLETELKIIKTTGDRDRKTPLAQVAGVQQVEKGIFIKELEEALQAQEVDIAVHSLKDMPSELDEPFQLISFLERANVSDILVSKHAGGIEGLPKNATVATGSVRRQRQLHWMRPDLKLIEFRGNVPTRLKKTAEADDIDATMLACAGLERLEYPVGRIYEEGNVNLHLEILDSTNFIPAGGQGAIAVEAHAPSEELIALLKPLNCRQTELETNAERAFLKHLNAGCDTPVAVHAKIDESGNAHLKARYWRGDDTEPEFAEVTGNAEHYQELAKQLVENLKKS